MLQEFGFKYIDIMIGIILGIGFQWWPDLNEPWQYIAFVFVYMNLVDYWMDYSPTLKKFPLKREIDILIHTAIIFGMFFLVYSTMKPVTYFLAAFIFYRLADLIWCGRMRKEYAKASHIHFVETWYFFDFIEVGLTIMLFIITWFFVLPPLIAVLIFIAMRVSTRIAASVRYRKIHFS